MIVFLTNVVYLILQVNFEATSPDIAIEMPIAAVQVQVEESSPVEPELDLLKNGEISPDASFNFEATSPVVELPPVELPPAEAPESPTFKMPPSDGKSWHLLYCHILCSNL
jgi:hypothetical protein